MNGPGSAGNVIAALCSFFVPGLGQLLQGRVLAAILMFCVWGVLWLILLGWLMHLIAAIDAAVNAPQRQVVYVEQLARRRRANVVG